MAARALTSSAAPRLGISLRECDVRFACQRGVPEEPLPRGPRTAEPGPQPPLRRATRLSSATLDRAHAADGRPAAVCGPSFADQAMAHAPAAEEGARCAAAVGRAGGNDPCPAAAVARRSFPATAGRARILLSPRLARRSGRRASFLEGPRTRPRRSVPASSRAWSFCEHLPWAAGRRPPVRRVIGASNVPAIGHSPRRCKQSRGQMDRDPHHSLA